MVKKQQDKGKSTLTDIAAKAGTSEAALATPGPGPSPSANARTPAPAVTFSNNTERLQQINRIRKAPVGAQIKRQALTTEEMNEQCHVDVNSNKAVFNGLRNNPKVHYDGKHFSYKSKHDLKDKNQLFVLIRKFLEGIAVIDLKDVYPTVMDDLQDLKAAGNIWLLSNFDSQEDVVYPNDPRVPMKVDDELKSNFDATKCTKIESSNRVHKVEATIF